NYSPSIVPIDAGIPGTPVTIPDSWYLNGIDCWKAASCVVVGENKTEEGIVDIVTGSTAPAPKVIKESEYLYGAGCDSSGDCVLTGASTPGADGYSTAIVVDWAKGAASSPRTIAATNGFGQVVCAGAGLGGCLSVGEKFAPPGA
ncbi:MAG TPA: hypothetical protein VGP46_05625, partial [Acidimicrobiales bacterium]|nr:hypothetical protein [Acidimicrobiales bacterium]